MNIETYTAKFQELRVKADKIGALYFKDRSDLQIGLTDLSVEAVTFYSANNNYGQSDYQLRVQILLDFDNYLKAIKKSKFPSVQDNPQSSKFFAASAGEDPDKNSALMNIKEPVPPMTKH